MSQYLLSSHVHLCRTRDHIVLLDLRRDKYLALGGEQLRTLSSLVKGWPGGEVTTTHQEVTTVGAGSALAQAMVDRGLLTKDPNRGRPAVPVALEIPRDSLAHSYFTEKPSIALTYVARFAAACASTALILRTRSIEHITEAVTRRKIRLAQRFPDFDITTARWLVAAFEGLRPFAFAGRDACMFDSLALVKFLAGYGLFPDWVFGVRTSPFAAHCWVQKGSMVFNDTPDRVSAFTPIMVV